MPRIDVTTVPARQGSGYPKPFDAACSARTRRRLGEAGGLRDFGVNLMTLPPGGWSSQRHWHSDEDEFVYLLEGEVTLVEDGGETLMRAGDCAAFPERHRQRPSPDQQVFRDRHLPGGGLAQSERPHYLLRHRHDELQRRRPVRAQGRHALLRVIAARIGSKALLQWPRKIPD